MNTTTNACPRQRVTFRAAATLAATVPVLSFVLAGCTGTGHAERPAAPPAAPAVNEASLKGFLAPDERPDSAALLPPPPQEGSALAAADVEIHRATRSLRDSPRWQVAAQDANLRFPAAAATFACALGVPITEAGMPGLHGLLQKTLVDAGMSTSAAKKKHQRQRPFVVFDETTCSPDDEKMLRTNGSYPSGHAAAGWAWALILAELAPDRADPILQRGQEFGASRVICGVHWQSDVDAGRLVASAAVARLHADDEFVAQMAQAAREIAQARAKAPAAPMDCTAEASALEGFAAR